MSDLDARTKDLLDRIHELRLLRDAQAPEGVLRDTFQARITALSAELVALQQVGPELERLTAAAASADAELRRALAEARPDADPWTPVAGGAAVVGVGLLLVSLWWGIGPVTPCVGVVLIVAAVAALSASGRHRRDAAVRVDAARLEVSRVAGLRAGVEGQGWDVPALSPQGVPPAVPAVSPPAVPRPLSLPCPPDARGGHGGPSA